MIYIENNMIIYMKFYYTNIKIIIRKNMDDYYYIIIKFKDYLSKIRMTQTQSKSYNNKYKLDQFSELKKFYK
jgi:hypothetical protein